MFHGSVSIVLVIGWLQAAQGERDGLMAGYWLYRYTGMDFSAWSGSEAESKRATWLFASNWTLCHPVSSAS
jgi:hypothetical protein